MARAGASVQPGGGVAILCGGTGRREAVIFRRSFRKSTSSARGGDSPQRSATVVRLALGCGLIGLIAATGNRLLLPVDATTAQPHVLVVVEENVGYSAVIGRTAAPYINSLARTYANDSTWYGVRHPSLPNYLAMTSGSTWGVTNDCTTCGPFAGPSLGGQLSAAGIPWRAYLESMPSACYTGGYYGAYAKKHNPFVYFKDVVGTSSCASHVVPFTSFKNDMAGTHPPSFAWVTPNLNDDMHDGTVTAADTWLKTNIAPVLASAWFQNYASTFVLAMDEHTGDGSGCCSGSVGGHVVMVVVSKRAHGVGTVSITGDQYGTLRAIEETYGLALRGAATGSLHGDLRLYFGISVSTIASLEPPAAPRL